MPITPFIGRADFVAHIGQELAFGDIGHFSLDRQRIGGGDRFFQLAVSFPEVLSRRACAR